MHKPQSNPLNKLILSNNKLMRHIARDLLLACGFLSGSRSVGLLHCWISNARSSGVWEREMQGRCLEGDYWLLQVRNCYYGSKNNASLLAHHTNATMTRVQCIKKLKKYYLKFERPKLSPWKEPKWLVREKSVRAYHISMSLLFLAPKHLTDFVSFDGWQACILVFL
jgi:hypothetical protein